jgi:hypothetical protein
MAARALVSDDDLTAMLARVDQAGTVANVKALLLEACNAERSARAAKDDRDRALALCRSMKLAIMRRGGKLGVADVPHNWTRAARLTDAEYHRLVDTGEDLPRPVVAKPRKPDAATINTLPGIKMVISPWVEGRTACCRARSRTRRTRRRLSEFGGAAVLIPWNLAHAAPFYRILGKSETP